MTDVSEVFAATAAKIHEYYEARGGRKDWRRERLGASIVGKDCTRKLWYTFHWVQAPQHSGRRLRLFERGDREEPWLISDLRGIGVQVSEHDEDGNQWTAATLGGHFGGSTDGKITGGVPEAPKAPHVLELKTCNDSQFKKLQRKGVVAVYPEHHAQMQTYMKLLKIKRALYVAVNKNNDDLYSERIHYDKECAAATMRKGEAVINAESIPSKITEDPTDWQCKKLCDYHGLCHMGRHTRLERNCRTCTESTPLPKAAEDGRPRWHCRLHKREMFVEEQREGCSDHLFNPELIDAEPKEVCGDKGERSIVYEADGQQLIDKGMHLRVISS